MSKIKIHLHERPERAACGLRWNQVTQNSYLKMLSDVNCPECISSEYYGKLFAAQTSRRLRGLTGWGITVNPVNESILKDFGTL